MIFLWAIVAMSVVEYLGDSSFKNYARGGKRYELIIGIVAYVILIKLLIQALKSANLIYTNAMWDGISALVETALAIFLLKETLSNFTQWMGLLFIILGIVALHFGKIPV